MDVLSMVADREKGIGTTKITTEEETGPIKKVDMEKEVIEKTITKGITITEEEGGNGIQVTD